MALVSEQSPDFSTDRRVVAIVAPAPANSFATSSRFERFQRFHGKQGAAMHLAQEQQDITGKMSECAIALFIFTPTPIDLPPVECQSLRVPGSFGVLFRQRIPFLFIGGYFFLQRVNLSAGPGVSVLKNTRSQDGWPSHLLGSVVETRVRAEQLNA